MSSTKIIVLQLKELIYTVVFAILGIVLILLLLYMFSPKKEKEVNPTFSPLYQSGIYNSSFVLDNIPMEVEVRIENEEITSIRLVDLSSNLEVMYPFVVPTMQQIEDAIVLHQSLDIPIPDEYAYTSQYLMEAIEKALAKAQTHIQPTSTIFFPVEEVVE